MTDPIVELTDLVLPIIHQEADNTDEKSLFPLKSIEALKQHGFLGLISATSVGGLGQNYTTASQVIEAIARECSSTAMILAMHYSATAVIEKYGNEKIRREIASNSHLTTLAFSEKGSRSHFWAPVSKAEKKGDSVLLNAEKSWVTSAHHADSYVWSSQPISASGASSIFLVPRKAEGLSIHKSYNGMGLRGNDSTAIIAKDFLISKDALLGEDGGGLTIMLEVVLPIFNLLNAACSVGIMTGSLDAAISHVTSTKYEHLQSSLAELPTIRSFIAQMKIEVDKNQLLVADTAHAIDTGRADVMLRVLQCKASCGEAALKVTELAMRVCGGAAFRKEVKVERKFRDARAANIMAPTTDQLYDFIGKALCGLPVF